MCVNYSCAVNSSESELDTQLLLTQDSCVTSCDSQLDSQACSIDDSVFGCDSQHNVCQAAYHNVRVMINFG